MVLTTLMQTYLFWESCFWITETRISSWCIWFFCQLYQSRYSPLWTAFSDASQHILPCLCYLAKPFSAVLCKGMFLWDWQPWETKGPPACLPGELCPFLTTWPSLLASSTWRGFSWTKAKVIPPGFEIRLSPWEISLASPTCWDWRCSWRCRRESPGWHRQRPTLRNV